MKRNFIIREIKLRTRNQNKRLTRSSKYLAPIVCRINKKQIAKKYFLVKDQDESTCLATSLSSITEYVIKYNKKYVSLSPTFIHYNAHPKTDEKLIFKTGINIFSFLNAVSKYGIIENFQFPYSIKEIDKDKIERARLLSSNNKIVKYGYIKPSKDIVEIVKILIASNIPIAISLPVSFETDDDMKYPVSIYDYQLNFVHNTKTEGHTIILTGFDNFKKKFKYLNSWGDDWGKDGYQFLPFSYVEDAHFIEESSYTLFFIVSVVFEGALYSLEKNLPKFDDIVIKTEISDISQYLKNP